MMALDNWLDPDIILATDASLVGYGAFAQGKFCHGSFPQDIQALHLHINALELLTIVVSVKLWGSLWSGLRIHIFFYFLLY